MKLIALVLLLPSVFAFDVITRERNLVCFYDSASSIREGGGKLSNQDLALATQFCTHLIYGYAGIRNYEAHSLNEDLDIKQHQFIEVTSLKIKYPELKVLLSLGGDRDIDDKHPNKYIELLEAGSDHQKEFAKSALSLVKTYGFDGLDLAYQFPKNKPKEVHSALSTGDSAVDPDADKHKEQFTSLVREVKDALHPSGCLLSLTVLPNVNSTWYFDIPKLDGLVDFVNLAAFDFVTPERNPEEADISAPFFGPVSPQQLPYSNVHFQTEYWINQFPIEKINLGIPSHGNAWKLTEESGKRGDPIVPHTNGPAPAGYYSKKAGLLSYAEICIMLVNPEKEIEKISYGIPNSYNFGNYAFRPAKDSNEGIWISYDDFETIARKSMYRDPDLGGLALFDLGYDEFAGVCKGEKFPVLRTIRNHFQKTKILRKWID